VNTLQFAILLATVLFGGHSALHRWDIRQTRRALLQRASRFPEYVVRAWVEGREDDGSAKLWLRFTGGQPHIAAQGRMAVPEAVVRLGAVGITVERGAVQPPEMGAAIHREPRGPLPGQHRSRAFSAFSPVARARLFRWRVQSMVRRAAAFSRRLRQAA
jgi:hypothetical protein